MNKSDSLIAGRYGNGLDRSRAQTLNQLLAMQSALLTNRLRENAISSKAETSDESGLATFDVSAFLSHAGPGRRVVEIHARRSIYLQHAAADSIVYIQSGCAKLSVVSSDARETTVGLLMAGDFAGEDSLSGAPAFRTAAATAITGCVVLMIEREEMMRILHEQQTFSDLFLRFLVIRGIRARAHLVNQLLNSSEKRLGLLLLSMAEIADPGGRDTLIPKISQATLAEMIGTTRSRVSFFMNRFRELGVIEYSGHIRIHQSLLHGMLADSAATTPASRRGPNRLAR